jgi:hypothetical protein
MTKSRIYSHIGPRTVLIVAGGWLLAHASGAAQATTDTSAHLTLTVAEYVAVGASSDPSNASGSASCSALLYLEPNGDALEYVAGTGNAAMGPLAAGFAEVSFYVFSNSTANATLTAPEEIDLTASANGMSYTAAANPVWVGCYKRTAVNRVQASGSPYTLAIPLATPNTANSMGGAPTGAYSGTVTVTITLG